MCAAVCSFNSRISESTAGQTRHSFTWIATFSVDIVCSALFLLLGFRRLAATALSCVAFVVTSVGLPSLICVSDSCKIKYSASSSVSTFLAPSVGASIASNSWCCTTFSFWSAAFPVKFSYEVRVSLLFVSSKLPHPSLSAHSVNAFWAVKILCLNA